MSRGNKPTPVYRPAFQATMVVVGSLLALWLLFEIRQLLVTIAAALIFASAISPAVNALVARRLPRALAILSVYVALVAATAALLLAAVPPLARESAELVVRLVASAGQVEGWVRSAQESLGHQDILSFNLDAALGQALQASSSIAPGLLRVTFTVASGVVSLLLVLAIAFYWLVERKDIESTAVRLMAEEQRGQFLEIWREIDAKLGAYVRGQLLDAAVVGLLTFLGLALLGVEFALPLALIAAITGLIPIVGATLGAIPAVLIGFSQSPQTAALVLALYLIVQQIEGNLLAPKIMQQSVGISALTVLLAVVIGGSLMGVVGAMLAIPSAAAAQVLVVRLLLKEQAAQVASPGASPRVTRTIGESDKIDPKHPMASGG